MSQEDEESRDHDAMANRAPRVAWPVRHREGPAQMHPPNRLRTFGLNNRSGGTRRPEDHKEVLG